MRHMKGSGFAYEAGERKKPTCASQVNPQHGWQVKKTDKQGGSLAGAERSVWQGHAVALAWQQRKQHKNHFALMEWHGIGGGEID